MCSSDLSGCWSAIGPSPLAAHLLPARTMQCPGLLQLVAAEVAWSRSLNRALMASTFSFCNNLLQNCSHFKIAVMRSNPPILNQSRSPQRGFSLESCTCALFEIIPTLPNRFCLGQLLQLNPPHSTLGSSKIVSLTLSLVVSRLV